MFKSFLNKFLNLIFICKKYLIAFGCFLILSSIIKLFNYSLSDNITDADYEDYFNTSYKTFNIRIPKNINFADEKVPINDFTVRKAVEKELIINTYLQSKTLLLHKRCHRWFPLIEIILKKNNIPDDFKYIALIESQLSNVVSPQGATGFWQLIESTAKNYGLEITDEVDERYNIEKATEAACKYFNEAYKHFNNWTLVAASYNLGMGGIQAQLDKQKVKSYYDLTLIDETARYIFRILAMKEIISRPKVYGYELRKKDLYPIIPTKKMSINSGIQNIATYAIEQGNNYKIFKMFNPWLRSNTLTNVSFKKYIIEIPKNGFAIDDMEGNYFGIENLNSKDSSNLISPSELKKDSMMIEHQ